MNRAVLVAVVGIGVHAFNHFTIGLQDVLGGQLSPGAIYHPVSFVLYTWLALAVLDGKNWARITISVLLLGQFAGRFFVLFAYPEAWPELVGGWAVSLVVGWLLWVPQGARAYFRKREVVG
ncbi:hypothetical protein C8D87_1021017 [Lentzea atacamensis]|uniref:DUF4345 domain-containing protein n=1 Tax=Lentzea atacamensis TaxID=531938 RepID=A0ABX9EE68_9PSEU|nr:hypothetical protein [Lentzea atacamensis]RAS68939.1 hypothetical protein C8D87_1021017 [Lentzea atacamensis]